MVELPSIVAIMMERNVKQQMGSLSETFVGLITESQTTNHKEVLCEKSLTEATWG